MIHKTDMEEIMYQKIIELLRIHGYLSQDTEKAQRKETNVFM